MPIADDFARRNPQGKTGRERCSEIKGARLSAGSATELPSSRNRDADQPESEQRHGRRFRDIIGLGKDGVDSVTLATGVGCSPGINQADAIRTDCVVVNRSAGGDEARYQSKRDHNLAGAGYAAESIRRDAIEQTATVIDKNLIKQCLSGGGRADLGRKGKAGADTSREKGVAGAFLKPDIIQAAADIDIIRTHQLTSINNESRYGLGR